MLTFPRPPQAFPRRRRAAPALLLLLLLAASQLCSVQASLNILWRHAVLSFDSPATQVFDELAVQKTSFDDPLADVLAAARIAAGAARAGLPEAPRGPAISDVLSPRLGRSPPAA